MMNAEKRMTIARETLRASRVSKKEWKSTVHRLYTLYGKDALCFANVDLFKKPDDVYITPLPYEEVKDNTLLHVGLIVEQAHIVEGELCTYRDHTIILNYTIHQNKKRWFNFESSLFLYQIFSVQSLHLLRI